MLTGALHGMKTLPFYPVQGNMTGLPFRDNSFDKTVSITALEFIEDAQKAVNELFRVTRPGGLVVVATLNSLSPWAVRRDEKSRRGETHILKNAFYRSPTDLLSLSDIEGETGTAVHFLKDDEPVKAAEMEKENRPKKPETGAFVAVRWRKPG